MEVINMFISIFQACITMFFNLEIVQGVSLGWIFLVVVVMFIIIKFFLKGEKDG